MAFSKSNVNFQFQQPNVPGLVRQAPDISGGLETLFNQYMQMKQGQRADQASGLQAQAAQQQIALGQDQAAMAPLTRAAQFGGVDPLAKGPEGLRQAMGPATMVESQDISGIRSAIEQFMAQKKSAASLASQEQTLGMDKTRSEIAENEAQAGKFKTEAKMAGANRGLKAEGELRGELQTLSKPFIQVRDAMGRIEASAKNPTAAGDLALIFNYMKVLDPGSTVREGEFATAQNSAGIPERVVAQYNKAIRGERLAPEQRQDFLGRARELYQSQLSIQKQQEEQYRGLSGRLGARPENVILDQSLPNFGGGQGQQTPESIRAEFQAGRITREQAKASIAALRGGANGRP